MISTQETPLPLNKELQELQAIAVYQETCFRVALIIEANAMDERKVFLHAYTPFVPVETLCASSSI